MFLFPSLPLPSPQSSPPNHMYFFLFPDTPTLLQSSLPLPPPRLDVTSSWKTSTKASHACCGGNKSQMPYDSFAKIYATNYHARTNNCLLNDKRALVYEAVKHLHTCWHVLVRSFEVLFETHHHYRPRHDRHRCKWRIRMQSSVCSEEPGQLKPQRKKLKQQRSVRRTTCSSAPKRASCASGSLYWS